MTVVAVDRDGPTPAAPRATISSGRAGVSGGSRHPLESPVSEGA